MLRTSRFIRSRHTSLVTRHASFTLLEILVVIAIIAILMVLAIPAFNSINSSRALTRAVNDVAGFLELARAEAMSTRSYVYVGFADTTNSDGNSEVRIAAAISIDGSSNTNSANLRALSKVVKLPNVQMTNYSNLPSVVKSAADISLQTDTDYVLTFPTTTYLNNKFNDTSFNSCPTITITPQGDIVHSSNPAVFFRTTTSVGLVQTHGTMPITTDGAIVSYYGGTARIRLTRPL